MASDRSSSNPFRRKSSVTPDTALEPQAPPTSSFFLSKSSAQQAEPLDDLANLTPINTTQPPKIAKKVRVQSPPPLSPSSPAVTFLDPAAANRDNIYAKPPTPVPILRSIDPFDNAETASDSEEELATALYRAPANPFAKTLETMERADREAAGPLPNVTSPGRASMDVEAFKRMLLGQGTGSGGSTSNSVAPENMHQGMADGASSADNLSVSRQSIFEFTPQAPSESPRTSHEMSEPEDYSRTHPPISRKKPPPPSSRHGKLLRVELRDDHTSAPSSPKGLISPQLPTPNSLSANVAYFSASSPVLHRSNSDLNKPLPPAPIRTSHDSDRESIFDKESAGKTPEPPSPSSSLRRKTAPPPPLARRQSHRTTAPRSAKEPGRLSPKQEENVLYTVPPAESVRRSDSTKAPPPPPTRRPASIRRETTPTFLLSPTGSELSPITPARGTSKSISGRPPSISSFDMNANKRVSMAPPPPPHRHRGSIDSDRRISGELARRPSGESSRNVSSPLYPEADRIGGTDILAEVTRLQQEIDALRTQSLRHAS